MHHGCAIGGVCLGGRDNIAEGLRYHGDNARPSATLGLT